MQRNPKRFIQKKSYNKKQFSSATQAQAHHELELILSSYPNPSDSRSLGSPIDSSNGGDPEQGNPGGALCSLPSETLSHITAYLDLPDLLTLAFVNKHLKRHLDDESVWKMAFQRFYLGIKPDSEDVNSSHDHTNINQAHRKKQKQRVLLLKRVDPNSWKREYIMRYTSVQGWKKSKPTTITHSPTHSHLFFPVSSMHLLSDQSSLLCFMLDHGGWITRSVPATGKVLKDPYRPSTPQDTPFGGAVAQHQHPFPHQNWTASPSTCAIASEGNTAKFVWGTHSGDILYKIAPKVMETPSRLAPGSRSNFLDSHQGKVTCVAWATKDNINSGNSNSYGNGKEKETMWDYFVSGGMDGVVKVWQALGSTSQIGVIWTSPLGPPEASCVEVTLDFTSKSVVVVYDTAEVRLWMPIPLRGQTPSPSPSQSTSATATPSALPTPIPQVAMYTYHIPSCHQFQSASTEENISSGSQTQTTPVEDGPRMKVKRVEVLSLDGSAPVPNAFVCLEYEPLLPGANTQQTQHREGEGEKVAWKICFIRDDNSSDVEPHSSGRCFSVGPVGNLTSVYCDLRSNGDDKAGIFVLGGDNFGMISVWDWDGVVDEVENSVSRLQAGDGPQSTRKTIDNSSDRHGLLENKTAKVQQALFGWEAYSNTRTYANYEENCNPSVATIASNRIVIITGSSWGLIKIFDAITLVQLRAITSIVTSGSAMLQAPPYTPVTQILVRQEQLVASIGKHVVHWKAEVTVGSRMSKGKKSVKKGSASAKKRLTAKWHANAELQRSIVESQDKDEFHYSRKTSTDQRGAMVNINAHQQQSALAELGLLDEEEAIQYALMLSRESYSEGSSQSTGNMEDSTQDVDCVLSTSDGSSQHSLTGKTGQQSAYATTGSPSHSPRQKAIITTSPASTSVAVVEETPNNESQVSDRNLEQPTPPLPAKTTSNQSKWSAIVKASGNGGDPLINTNRRFVDKKPNSGDGSVGGVMLSSTPRSAAQDQMVAQGVVTVTTGTEGVPKDGGGEYGSPQAMTDADLKFALDLSLAEALSGCNLQDTEKH